MYTILKLTTQIYSNIKCNAGIFNLNSPIMFVFEFLFTIFLAVFSNKFYLVDVANNPERPDVQVGVLGDTEKGRGNFKMQSMREREHGIDYADDDEQGILDEQLNALKQRLIKKQRWKEKTKKEIPEEDKISVDVIEDIAKDLGKEYYNEKEKNSKEEKVNEKEINDENDLLNYLEEVSNEGEVANEERDINDKSVTLDIDEEYEKPDNIETSGDKKANLEETKEKGKSSAKEEENLKVYSNVNSHELPLWEGNLLSIKRTLMPRGRNSKKMS